MVKRKGRKMEKPSRDCWLLIQHFNAMHFRFSFFLFLPIARISHLILVFDRDPFIHAYCLRFSEWDWADASTRNDCFRNRSFARYLCIALGDQYRRIFARKYASSERANYARRIDCVNVGSADAFTFYTLGSLAPAVILSQPICFVRADLMLRYIT